MAEFNFHNYDSLTGLSDKKDPRRTSEGGHAQDVSELLWVAARGELQQVRRIAARGVSLDESDYDGRTALHVAAAEGRTGVVAFLVEQDVSLDVQDRWGHTPLDDATEHAHHSIVDLLERHLD